MIDVSLAQIRCFLEVCRDFHFSRAAERLGVAQPQVSRLIKELEETIGAPVFRRRSRGVELTASGEVFLQEIFGLPSMIRRAVEGARRAAEGEVLVLRIGFVGALLGEDLLGVFDRYRRENINTQLSLSDASPAEIVRQVEAGELDGGFLGVAPSRLPSRLQSFTWREEPLFVCLPWEHKWARRKRLRIADLNGQPMVVLDERLAPWYREFLDKLFVSKGSQLHVAQETTGSEAILSMVVAGCGLALLPKSALRGTSHLLSAVPLEGAANILKHVFLYRESPREELSTFLSVLESLRR